MFPEKPHPLVRNASYYVGYIYNNPVGYVGLGYGMQQEGLLSTLFDQKSGIELGDYSEIVRSYCRTEYKNSPSRLMSIVLRLLKKYTDKKFVYTTGAGYQGLTGRIYQATNFDYIGNSRSDSAVYYIPEIGYVHARSFSHRYPTQSLKSLIKIFPTIYRVRCSMFRYIYFLRDKGRLLKHAKFKIEKYPKIEDYPVEWNDGNGWFKVDNKMLYNKIVSLSGSGRYASVIQ